MSRHSLWLAKLASIATKALANHVAIHNGHIPAVFEKCSSMDELEDSQLARQVLMHGIVPHRKNVAMW